MMDIAEIRRKAKAGKTKAEHEELGLREEVADKPSSEPEATPVTIEDDDASEDLVISTLEGESSEPIAEDVGLEKLFALEDGFDLATEESYQEALSEQTEEADLSVHQYLAFQLGEEEYALDITRISEIIKAREFTEIPRVPDYILGIISLRGVVVPVFDLKRRFKLGEANITAASRVIVCQVADMTAGLLVDSINQVVTLAGDAMEPPPAVLSGLDRDLVEGVGRYQGRMIIVLHLQSVLDVDLT